MAICSIDNCDSRHLARGYCSKHYYRVKRGKGAEAPTRSDKRKAVVVGAIAKIPLGVNAQRGYALVDVGYAHLDQYKWSIGGRGYVMAYVGGEMQKLHHLVMGKPSKGMVVDHKNRDPLDNRKSNLRFVTPEINAINKSMNRLNTSGYKGVTWDKSRKKWLAQIKFRDAHKFLGYFQTPEEAHRARRAAELNNEVFKEALYAR